MMAVYGDEDEQVSKREGWLKLAVVAVSVLKVLWGIIRRSKLRCVLLFALLPGSAHAVSDEICGNGIDDPLQTGGSANGTKGSCPAGFMDSVVGLGCDRKCPGVDQDDDGYTSDGTTGTAGTTNVDCDDTNRLIFPGVYVPDSVSSPTGYKLCQTSGSYSSVVLNADTPLCEATGSGVCKYIHCGTGNNANTGTYASPYQTLGKVAGGSPGSPPGSPFTLTAGSVVYVLGGTCSTTYSNGTYNVLADFTADGTSTDKIRIKRYPGSTATFVTTDGPGFLASGDHTTYEDIDISTARTSALIASSFRVSGDNVRISRVYAHDLGGHGDNNDGCVHFEHTSGGTVDHSFFEDCKRQTGNVDNIHAIGWLDDDGVASECQNHSAKWNTIWYSTYDDTVNGACWRQKHGCLNSDVGVNGHPIMYSSCTNAVKGIYWNSSGLDASDLVFSDVHRTIYIGESGENTPQENNELSYSTIVDSSNLQWNYPYYTSGTETLAVNHIVMTDDDASYSSGNIEGIFSIDGYGTDAQKTQFEAEAFLTSDYNCFYNALTALVFSYFSAPSGSGGHGPAGNAGGNYSFANWKLNTSQDAHSYNENPTFNDYLQATSVNCSDKGRRYTASAATPTPSPTPTPTASYSGGGAYLPYLQ